MAVPTEYQDWVDRLRSFLRDTVDQNILEGVQESTDDQLYEAIYDAIEEINKEFPPKTAWTVANLGDTKHYLSWNSVKYGATLQVLTSVGILSSRNTLTYNDTGGVTVQDYDKYGRYINYFNLLLRKYYDSVEKIKRAYNADNCYGGIGSDFSNIYTGDVDGRWW